MRKILLLAGCLLLMAGTFAETGTDELIKFDKIAYAFGKVEKGKPVSVEFKFTNPGKKPLIIEDATAECGCTKPEFPKQPIMPGKTGVIKVTYDAKEGGNFTKKVTVKLVNVADTKILTISGEVI
jgi:hypothetical protein